ncbi:MAG: response regulator transcription factor [Candidatus Dormibacteria bacterium]
MLIVDDQAPFRHAAAAVVALSPGFSSAAEVESGEAAVEAASRLRPDLLLMDINLPGINGIETTRRVLAALPETTVLLLSTYPLDELPADARTCGAAGYVNKESFDPASLAEAWEHRGSGFWAAVG